VPAFLLSESRNVGYAAPWFRAPNEVYGSEVIQNLDGAQVMWNSNLGPIGLGLQGSFGNTKVAYLNTGGASTVNVKNMYNLSATLQYENLMFRIAQTTVNLPTTIPLGPGFAVNFNLDDKVTSVGFQYDDGSAIVLAEWSRRSEALAPIVGLQPQASRQWYVADGWRFGKLTPLLMYGKFDPLNSLVRTAGSYGTWSASLRYDVVRNIALKAQFSRPQAGNDTYWITPDHASNERVNVFSLGADFVF
jgi:hypothetical protein